MAIRLHRKNFLPTLIINLVLWTLVILMVLLVSPNLNWPWRLVGLSVLLWLAIGLTASLVVGKTKTGFLLATVITVTLLLRVLL